MSQRFCISCGNEFIGNYCSHCGEKFLSEKDKSVKKWLGSVFSDLAMIDGKLLLTLKELFFTPSRYADNYSRGIRVRYIKRLNLFLLANLVYFLISSFDRFKTSLNIQMSGLPYSSVATKVVQNKLEDKDLNLDSYRAAYDQKTNEISKVILIIMAPLLGIVLYLLFGSRGLYLSDAFNIALQFWAFFIGFFMLFLQFVGKLIGYFGGTYFFNSDGILSVIILIISGMYFWFLMRSWKSKYEVLYTGRLLVAIGSFYPMLILDRAILFILTVSLT